MKDINKVEAFNQMNLSRQLIHERNQRIAELWWKYWARRKVTKAAKKGKHEVYVLSPVSCSLQICNLINHKGFHYNTYRANILFMEVYINWA